MKNTNKTVKKHHSYWVLLLMVLFSGAVNAKVNNYVGAYANVGEWTLLPSQSNYGPSFGVAGGAGFLYELQAGGTYSPTRFLFDVGVGAQGGMTSYIQSSNMTEPLPGVQTDLDGDPFTYIYEIQDRHDQYNNLAVQVPIMIGVQHRKFYMLAGVKVGANVLTRAHSTAIVNTFGRYQDPNNKLIFDDFRNMPEYQFFDGYQLKGSAKASLGMNVDLSFEIGGRIGQVYDAVGYDVPKRKIEYRLAAFVDYGLLDIHTNRDLRGIVMPEGYNVGATSPVYNTTSMIDNLQVNDIMSTQTVNADGTTQPFAKSVNNLMVGIKFTVLFQLPEPGQCVICRDAYGSSIRRRGSSRGMKYEE